jgi:hypothetical protein
LLSFYALYHYETLKQTAFSSLLFTVTHKNNSAHDAPRILQQQNTNGQHLTLTHPTQQHNKNPSAKISVFKERCFVCNRENVDLFVSRYLHHKLSDASSWHSDDTQAINQPAM